MMAPDPREAVDAVLRDFKNALHTCFPARVVRYYPDKQTVDVQACIVRQVPGEYWEPDEFEEIPELVNIPVGFPRAGGFVITFPIKVGDYVAVLCSEQCLLVWRERGGVNVHPGVVDDEHGLNGCFAVPAAGFWPDDPKNTLRNVSTDNFQIRREDGSTTIDIAPDGTVHIRASEVIAGNGAAPRPVAIAQLVEQAIAGAITNHTHAVPASPTPATSGNGVPAAPVSSTAAAQLKAT